MKKLSIVSLFTLFLTASCLLAPRFTQAYELEEGLNAAGLIVFPTALNQPVDHAIHTTVEMTDVEEPEAHVANYRYGYQLGIFQLIADANYLVEPLYEFNHLELKGKLHVLSLDEFRTYVALGLLGRFVEDDDESDYRISGREASFFAIGSIELFPFDSWGGFLFNLYLDNRYTSGGLKAQLYPAIQVVAETYKLHESLGGEKWINMVGLQVEAEQNFYMQLLYSNLGANWFIQLGTGF